MFSGLEQKKKKVYKFKISLIFGLKSKEKSIKILICYTRMFKMYTLLRSKSDIFVISSDKSVNRHSKIRGGGLLLVLDDLLISGNL